MKVLIDHYDQKEYFRIMEKRIRYFADKYDRNRQYGVENNSIMESRQQGENLNFLRSAVKQLIAFTIF